MCIRDSAYCVHSFAVPVDDAGDAVLADTDHGARFAAVVGQGRRFGAQFHPCLLYTSRCV